MKRKKLQKMAGLILSGCILCTSVCQGTVMALGTEGVDEPYNPFQEPDNTYDVAGMKASVGTKQSGNYGGDRVLDKKPDTLWEGQWDKVEMKDAWITLDLGEARTVSGLAQLPRGNKFLGGDLNGVITTYEVYVSTDGGKTYEKKTEGVWNERKEWKYAIFEPVENVTHIKLQAVEVSQEPKNPKNVTIAELRVLDGNIENGRTDELKTVLEEAKKLNKDDYTQESFDSLIKVIAEAEELLQREYYLQDEIDIAKERIEDAIADLQDIGDMKKVVVKLGEAKAITNEDNHYYANTYYALSQIIKDVEYKVQKGMTGEEIEENVAALQKGIDGLIVRNPAEQHAFDTTAAMDSIKRLVGEKNQDKLSQIELRAIDKKSCDYDYYEYYEQDGKLVIAATTNASILTGFNHWLKYVANCNISWKEDQVNLPDNLPMPKEPVYQSTNAQRRFAGNDMTEQYDGNFWSFEDWEREIDLLALNGFNEVLVYVGQENVFYKTFEELGVSDMLEEMPRVSFVPSLFLGGSWRFKADDKINSPNIMTSMTPDIMQTRLEIGQKVCQRLRELGMEPIMPGCSGYLAYAADEIEGLPKEDVVSQGAWASMPRPGWLKSTSEFYPKLASTYYRIQEELFGECKNWKIDLFNEGGTMGGVKGEDVGRCVQAEMLKVHPDATWHIMHWTGPNTDILKGTDTSKVFIHDIKTTSEFDREERWNGAEYGFTHLNSMGSRTTMGSRVKDLSQEYWERKAKPGSKMDGVGVAPEGGHHEPIVLESLGELAWQDGPIDGEEWFLNYADRRYGLVNGKPDEHARKAWEILGDTVYNKTGNNPTGDILFAMSPSHTGTMASPTGPGSLGFDAVKMREALEELLQVSPALRNTDTYQYDLILVTTQVFTAYTREALPKIKEAFEEGNVDLYEKLTGQWLDAILILDEITGTNKNFMLGPWIEQAKNIATSEEGKRLMEMDAKQINTTWGPRVSGAKGMFLNYANKTWNGYLKDVYYRQWEMFFANNLADLKGEAQPYPEVKTSNGEVNFDKWYDALWIDFGKGKGEFEGKQYATEPTGDTYELVKEGLGVLGYEQPEKIQNLEAEQTEGSSDITLSWEEPKGGLITYYEIYQNGEKIGQTEDTFYTISGLEEETEYTFSVKAVNSAGYESDPAEIKATTGKDMQAPKILSAQFSGEGSVKVVFDEAVSKETAQNADNYLWNYGLHTTKAMLGEDSRTVELTVEGEKEGQEIFAYELTVNHVKDKAKSENTCHNIVLCVRDKGNIMMYQSLDSAQAGETEDILGGIKGKLVGTPQETEGIRGKALHFGAADEYVDFGRQESVLQNQFSVSLWVNLDKITPGTSQTLLTHGHSGNVNGGVWWLYTNNGTLNFQLYKTNHKVTVSTKDAVLDAGKWHHVALTRDERKVKLFVDGKNVASGTIASNIDPDTTEIGYTLKAGAEYKTGQNKYDSLMGLNGSLDEIVIYNCALTEEQIKNDMDNGVLVQSELKLEQNGNLLNWNEIKDENIELYRVVFYDENMQEREILTAEDGLYLELPAQNAPGYVKVDAVDQEGTIRYESNYLYVEKDSDEQSNISTAVLEYALGLANKADTRGVIKSVVERFEALKSQAEDILTRAAKGDNTLTQEMVDQTWKDLISVMQYLSFKQGDKEDLVKVIELADSLDLSKYLEEGQDAFNETLSAAEAVNADGDAMQEEVDSAWKALLKAMSDLRLKPSKAALEALIASAETVSLADAKEADAAMFRTALADAKAVYVNEQATEEEVKTAVDTLAAAMDKVASAAGDEEDKTADETTSNVTANASGTESKDTAAEDTSKVESKKASSEKSAKTGDTTNAAGAMAAMLAVLAGAAVVFKRKKM